MSDQTLIKLPTWFWIVAVAALLWNLLGVMAFVGQVTLTPEALAKMEPGERALYENVPVWATIAFALAVFGGALGCVLLLLRKGLASTVFLISLIGIVVQMGYNFLLSGSLAVYGPGALAMPVMILIIGAGLLLFSKHAAKVGWIS
ncbi:MAG: hypothetical protein AAGJ73_10770 [Pseudomonadota bacterium]